MASAPKVNNPGTDFELGEKAEMWYEKNSRLITVALAIALVGFLGYKGYNYFHQSRIEAISAESAPVMEGVTAALNETDDAKRRDKLKGALSESERLASSYAGSVAGRTAQLAVGNIHYYLSAGLPSDQAQTELKTARTAFEKYLADAVTPEEKAAGQLALGHTLENLWYFNSQESSLGLDATKAYQSVEPLFPGSFLSAEAKLSQARLLQVQSGRQDQAKKLYTELAADRRIDLSEYSTEKPLKLENGRELSTEEIAKIKTGQPDSYESIAQKSIARLNALAAAK